MDRAWLLGLASLAIAGQTLAAAVAIVVDPGPYPNPSAAAHAEAEANWLDGDKSDDTACTECFAAEELQRGLRRMTGRGDDFRIVRADSLPAGPAILVGQAATRLVPAKLREAMGLSPTALAPLGREGYRLKTGAHGKSRFVIIAGQDRVGTLYGTYEFLHRLGCRWHAPGDLHEEIPLRGLDRLPDMDVAEGPAFFTRGFHAWENRGDPDFLLWMARNRLNYWCVEQKPHALLHKLGIQMSCGGHVAQSMFLNPSAAYPYDHPVFQGDEPKPKDPYPVGELYQGDANRDGKLTYFEAHPEWYAEVAGTRTPGIRGGAGTNYCTSNPHATGEFMKNFVECLAAGKWRAAGVVRFWTLDGGKWCQCAECKALGIPTDRNLLLVHRLDQEIKKARAAGRIHRPIIIRFLAYADVLHPPTRPLPAGFDYDTCSATYFPICRCYVHQIDDPTCSRNARYAKHLFGWAQDPKRHYKGQICIGEYYNVSGYKCLPICFMHTMEHDIPYYFANGARHFHYMHCTTGNWGNKALTNYQMARQLWDPKTDCAALWRDYFATRYGPAGADMRGFYEHLERMLCNVTELKYGLARRLDKGAKKLFPNSRLQYQATKYDKSDGVDLVEMLASARQCRAAINGVLARSLPERVAQRVAEDERLFTYGERTLLFYDAAVRARRALDAKDTDGAQRARAEVVRLADLLRQDTTSTRLSSSHGNAGNGFAATYATGVLATLEDALGPMDPQRVKAFDVDKGMLVLLGTDFFGGGALKYGYHLHVYPGRIKVSDVGNFVYGQGARPHDRMTAWFRLADAPKDGLWLNMVGLCCPVQTVGKVAAQVRINGKVVFADSAPFSSRKLTAHQFHAPADAFRKGANRIEVRNVEPDGRVGNRPWFGIDRIEMRAKPLKPKGKPLPSRRAAARPTPRPGA